MRPDLTARPPRLAVAEGRNQRLRQRLAEPALLVAPGCFDCLTARIVEVAGFEAAYVTGAGVSMSALGAPDLGLISFAEVLDRLRRIADVLTIPVIADGDVGFGGPLNVMRTVAEFERAGVSAIQLEDQEAPKRCGHELGRTIASRAEMVARIKAACDARSDPDFCIIARTDARTTEGLAAALDRAEAYREAGADVLFVESPEDEDEMATITARLKTPCLANMVEGGRTPLLSAARLEALGFRLAIFPNSLTRLFAKQGLALMETLRREGTTAGEAERLYTHGELWSLFDIDDWLALEDRYGTRR